MAALGSAALIGASGLMTVIYAITKINYTYKTPICLIATRRRQVTATNIMSQMGLTSTRPRRHQHPYTIIDKLDEISLISRFYRRTRTVSDPWRFCSRAIC
jgi:sulfopyruvate decarboxylase TPP-binding subunit